METGAYLEEALMMRNIIILLVLLIISLPAY
ncbi:type I toxin-antitoxin system Ibs family toxin [[Pasteurella] aerogenes]|nr:type I toxin-antitoxin system Ibs family toxin [[Pasteurella] aerogenes]